MIKCRMSDEANRFLLFRYFLWYFCWLSGKPFERQFVVLRTCPQWLPLHDNCLFFLHALKTIVLTESLEMPSVDDIKTFISSLDNLFWFFRFRSLKTRFSNRKQRNKRRKTLPTVIRWSARTSWNLFFSLFIVNETKIDSTHSKKTVRNQLVIAMISEFKHTKKRAWEKTSYFTNEKK